MAKTRQQPPEPLSRGAEDFGAVVADSPADDLDDAPAPPPKAKPPKAAPRPADKDSVPRVIDPRDRAPAGLVRYKIRRANAGGAVYPTCYVLAEDEASARGCYLRRQNLPEDAGLVVVTLPD